MKPLPYAILGAGLLAISFIPKANGQLMYSVIPVPAPEGSGAYSASGYSINDFGEIVGRYSRYTENQENQIRAFHHSDALGSSDVWPEGYTSLAEGINNQGQITFYGSDRAFPPEAYRYTPGVGVEPLGSFGGSNTESEAINNLGQVTGYSEDASGRSIAFRFTDGLGLEPVGDTFSESTGYAINDLGWVAGWGDGHAFLFQDGVGTTDLGPGWAYGINNEGAVVGRSVLPSGGWEAFVYQDSTFQLLAQAGFQQTILSDINNQGIAVGTGAVPMGVLAPFRALIWTEETGFIDLNTLLPEDSGWSLGSAIAINELGQITGVGSLHGTPLAFRLDPIPEPSTWCLLSLGALLAWLKCRTHKRR